MVAAELEAFIDTYSTIELNLAAVSKTKWSNIRRFASVHDRLAEMLQFPANLSERYGLLEGDPQQLRIVFSARPTSGRGINRAEPLVATAEVIERLTDTRGRRPAPALTN